MMLLAQYHKSS